MSLDEQIKIDGSQTFSNVLLDKRVYSKAAILRACYWFGRDLLFKIEEQESHFLITASLRAPQPTLAQPKPPKVEDLLSDFLDALLDSQLRIEIQQETASIRELIIAKAFSESGVLEDPPPGTFEDPVAMRGSGTADLVQISPQEDE